MSESSPLDPARERARELAASGDSEAAVALLEHVISLGKVNLGEDDPGLLAAAHQLARLLLGSGDPAKARRVLEEAYAAGQWRLGDSSPLMLEISYDLGVVAEQLGNRHEARKALGRVVEAGTPVLGDFHWAVVKARAYLGGDTGALAEPVGEMTVAMPVVEERGSVRPPLPRRVPAHDEEELPRAYAEATADLPTQIQPVVRTDRGVGGPWQGAPTREPEVPRPRHEVQAQPVERPRPRPVELPTAPVERQQVERWGQPRLPEPQPPAPVNRVIVQPEVRQPPPASYQKRGPAVFAAVAAVLAAIISVAALLFVLADRGEQAPERAPGQPVLGGGPAPSDVRLRDFGSAVEIGWVDPGDGKTSFIVAGGLPGEVLKPMGEVGPGVTNYRLQGLNDQLNYCFAVLAVYSTTEFASSPQTCTSRPG